MTRLRAEQVGEAGERLRPFLPPTPLRPSRAAGPGGLLKLECWQPTGSFKVRGAIHVLLSLSAAERARGLVAASAGNHALGVAYAIQATGLDATATLFVPRSAPRSKRDKLDGFPVSVVESGATYDEAAAAARAHCERTGATFVHPFDDPVTAAGQGSVACEVLSQAPGVGSLLVPVGGGGLVAGIAAFVKAVRPDVRVVAVQPEASPALRESLRLGRPLLDFPAAPTLADGVAGGIGEIVFAHRDLIDEVVIVSEAEIEEAIVALLRDDQVVAEGSGALGVAALRSGRVAGTPERPAVAVVTGGNVDLAVLIRLLGRRA